jgi:hypothetical protein
MGYSVRVRVGLRLWACAREGSQRRGTRGRTRKRTISKAGAIMAPRFTSGELDSNANLPGHLLLRIVALILAICTLSLSLDAENKAYSAEKRSVPNILLILADDKY